MARRTGQMKLGAFFHPTGNHVAAWLHPDSQIDAGTNFAHYARIAQTAERAKFDLIFLADKRQRATDRWRCCRGGRNTWRISIRSRSCPRSQR